MDQVTVEKPVEEIDCSEYELAAGFAYPSFEVRITASEQQRLHRWCDIPENVFGASADPGLVSRLPIVLLANTVLQNRPGWAPVHTVQRIIQHRPVALDEVLRLEGRTDAFTAHARGETMHSTWLYFDAAGACVFEVKPQALLIDPAWSKTPQGRPHPTDERRWRTLDHKQCTPEATLGYCEGTNNPIHLDPEVAHSFGFRAPIIAGTQTMSFLLEPVYRAYRPESFELAIGFMRPVFWDDLLRLEAEEAAGGLRYLRAVNAADKVVADCSIAAMNGR